MLSSEWVESQNLCSSAVKIPLLDGIVRLTVTSPPYHNAINYEKHLDGKSWYRGNLEIPLDAYLENMFEALAEIYRVTVDSGFCCIVIGNELSNGTLIPLPHLLTTRICKPNGPWEFQEEIIWNKVTGGLDRFGVTIQRPYPTYYRANIMHEHILVFRKGKLTHEKHSGSRFEIDEVMKKDTSNSVWNIAPVPPRYIEHPCPFPEEVPHRLITLYSNKGDLVLDPFVGSGQTGKAAKHLSRRFVGTDIQLAYAKLATNRIENEKFHVRPQLVAKWEKISPN
ncbi:MAG: site-specific DNA-methyltransferase [Thaumarchaeota archaeon]|nr:site-specific DNA-methyltransferase [Nitrososphaerota archaeon]